MKERIDDAFKLLEERQIDVSKHKFHAREIQKFSWGQRLRLGALTTMPISVVSLPLTSNVLSSTRFMNWSNPRKTPTTFRFAFSFTAITTVYRQNMKLSNTALRYSSISTDGCLQKLRFPCAFGYKPYFKNRVTNVWEVTIRLHSVIRVLSAKLPCCLLASHESDEHWTSSAGIKRHMTIGRQMAVVLDSNST